ncbi:MAG: hypothetical protein L7R66_04320 [Candidatus Thalassarchaeaceae archaeon]|nr:hypothetical protein [Candidatus Thalassarchaeaceae archaeon]
MSKKIHISGIEGHFLYALKDRLSRAGAILIEDRHIAEFVISIGEGGSADMAILPPNVETDNTALIIKVHDLLSPEGKSTSWGDAELHRWARLIRDGADIELSSHEAPRHWVHVRDVCDALCTLIMSNRDEPMTGVLNIAGRRAWSTDLILQEMRMLWGRYSDSLSHTHTTKSLSSIPSPVNKSDPIEIDRPDLTLLHKYLRDCGSEGWHPLVPMRVALMEILAHASD